MLVMKRAAKDVVRCSFIFYEPILTKSTCAIEVMRVPMIP